MKSVLTVLLLILGIKGFAQNFTATYELSYKRDSTNRGDVRKENFMLLLRKEGSRFMSEAKYVQDSALATLKDTPTNEANIGMALGLMAKLPRTSFGEIIVKDSQTGVVTTYGSVLMNKLSYEEKPDFRWKVSPEKKQIGQLSCQKAETDFGGRHFVAWYAETLPFADGPYKFSGLPGLIVEVFDDKNDYHFLLQSLKPEDIKLPEMDKYVKTSKAKYFQARENFRSNPEAALMGTGIKITPNPTNPTTLKQQWAKKNNPIELKP